jgi:hypothetical protein
MTIFPCYSLHHRDIVSMASQRCCAIWQYLHPKHPIHTIEIARWQRAANSILRNKIDLYQSVAPCKSCCRCMTKGSECDKKETGSIWFTTTLFKPSIKHRRGCSHQSIALH